MEDTIDKAIKPTFDGRLTYFQELGKVLNGINESAITFQYERWYKFLVQYYSMVSPYCKDKDILILEQELEQLEKVLYNYIQSTKTHNVSTGTNLRVHREFRKFQQHIIFSSRHLWLPMNTDEEFEFDEDAFLKASDG